MRYFLIFIYLMFSFDLFAQNDILNSTQTTKRLDERIDEITYSWDLEADKLATYVGLSKLCADIEYRKKVFGMLEEIHHYDTVLTDLLKKMAHEKGTNSKEIRKTIKDINKLENGYSTKDFIHFMHNECEGLNNIESHYSQTVNGVGENSYSSEVYVLETELFKYVHHITNRVDRIREHVHHLSPHYEN